MSFALPIRLLGVVAALSLTAAGDARAQNAASAAPAHPVVCARGVRVYTDSSQVPAQHDTLTMPPAMGPIRVTSEAEAEAAEMAMRGRAGSVGATGVLVIDNRVEEDGRMRMTRNVTAVFVPADAARAQQACK